MRRMVAMSGAAVVLGLGLGIAVLNFHTSAAHAQTADERVARQTRPILDQRFQVDVIVNGRPLAEYYARGKSYIEALEGAEYELRIRNPLPERIAVALSVDGLNTIDARHTSAMNRLRLAVGK
jgi:hypothetical protein